MGLEFINKRKKELGLTNDELSIKSGVPLGTLSKITSGITKDPKLETLKSIARVLDCSLDDFDDETQETSIKSCQLPSLLPLEQTLLTSFNQLNFDAQKKLQGYADDLVANRNNLKKSDIEQHNSSEFSQELA